MLRPPGRVSRGTRRSKQTCVQHWRGRAMREVFPSPLREAVLHAQRFASELRRIDHDLLASEHSDPHALTEAESWIIGRPSEVDAFVGDVLREYRAKSRTLEDATKLVDGFLRTMHASYARAFGRKM